jgi:co-chaperonin GroES (HSP10)
MTLEEAFPVVDSGCAPLGGRVLVQFKQTPKKTTASGIILVEETKETEKWNTQVCKVIELGALAYRNRDTLELWAEGVWAAVGDYVRVPRWGGDRWEVPLGEDDKECALFAIFNDNEVISKVTGDPLKVKAFL